MNKFKLLNYSINLEIIVMNQLLYNFKEKTDLNDKILILCTSFHTFISCNKHFYC